MKTPIISYIKNFNLPSGYLIYFTDVIPLYFEKNWYFNLEKKLIGEKNNLRKKNIIINVKKKYIYFQ